MAKQKDNDMVALSKSECVSRALETLGVDTPAREVGEYVSKHFRHNIPLNYLNSLVSSRRTAIKKGKVAPSRKTGYAQSPALEDAGKNILDIVRDCDDLEACLSLVRRLKGMNLEEVESTLSQIVKMRDIVGDKTKALEAFQLLKT